jgi:NAD(P)H dehydrogenase (quinone)
VSDYVLVLYYSKNGTTFQLAQAIAEGVEKAGLEARLRTIPPVSATCEAVDPAIPQTGAPYVTLDDLRGCRGLALGSPTHFGNMAAPMKYFWDNTAELWLSGALVDKPACVFSSSASMHGGQEMTLMTMIVLLMHHGMTILGIPYTEPSLSKTTGGGTPYGATHVSHGNPHSMLTEDEMTLARAMGHRLGKCAL